MYKFAISDKSQALQISVAYRTVSIPLVRYEYLRERLAVQITEAGDSCDG